ncbi:epithelial membrane protein 1-like [Physella acuta]|uniref:epithelial membrane protein 1-like n=1 Tax=Physella acuta TaxID=109671 RepID=UPI0027DDE500|nr:epithelial membrane protein 1-like [Physella acuta]
MPPTMPTHTTSPTMPTHTTYPTMPTHTTYPTMPTHTTPPTMPTHTTPPTRTTRTMPTVTGIQGLNLIGSSIITVAVIMQIAGQAMPYWLVNDKTHQTAGLWEYCDSIGCYGYRTDNLDPRLEASRVFAIMGVVSGVGSIIMTLIYICHPMRNDQPDKVFPFLSCVAGFIAGFCVGVCVLTWLGYTQHAVDRDANNQYGTSFVVSCIAGILILYGSVITMCVLARKQSNGYQRLR